MRKISRDNNRVFRILSETKDYRCLNYEYCEYDTELEKVSLWADTEGGFTIDIHCNKCIYQIDVDSDILKELLNFMGE